MYGFTNFLAYENLASKKYFGNPAKCSEQACVHIIKSSVHSFWCLTRLVDLFWEMLRRYVFWAICTIFHLIFLMKFPRLTWVGLDKDICQFCAATFSLSVSSRLFMSVHDGPS